MLASTAILYARTLLVRKERARSAGTLGSITIQFSAMETIRLARLLRPRRKWPRRRRAAEQRDELPPPHSITSSATARTTTYRARRPVSSPAPYPNRRRKAAPTNWATCPRNWSRSPAPKVRHRAVEAALHLSHHQCVEPSGLVDLISARIEIGLDLRCDSLRQRHANEAQFRSHPPRHAGAGSRRARVDGRRPRLCAGGARTARHLGLRRSQISTGLQAFRLCRRGRAERRHVLPYRADPRIQSELSHVQFAQQLHP
jgi:hypothetical protein